MFNRIKEETEDHITLTNYLESVIVSLFCFIVGLIILWDIYEKFVTAILNYSNTSDSTTILGLGIWVVAGGLCIWCGFNNLLFKSKAEIEKNYQKIFVERKSIIKCLESFREIFLIDVKEIEIKHTTSLETGDSWNIYFITNTRKPEFFFSSSSESETKKLANKISQIINPQIPICESKVCF